MSDCSKKIKTKVTSKAESISDLDAVTRLIVRYLLKKHSYVWVYGSRHRGTWNFCSDFDFALPVNIDDSISLTNKYSNFFGVSIDIIGSDSFDGGLRKGLKIKK